MLFFRPQYSGLVDLSSFPLNLKRKGAEKKADEQNTTPSSQDSLRNAAVPEVPSAAPQVARSSRKSSPIEAFVHTFEALTVGFRMMWQASPRATALRATTAVARALQPLVYGGLLGKIVSELAAAPHASIFSPALITPAVGMAVTHFVYEALSACDRRCAVRLDRPISLNFGREFRDALFGRSHEAVTSPHLSGMAARVRDNEWRIITTPDHAIQSVQLVLTLAFAAVAITQTPWPVAAAVLLGAIIPLKQNLRVAKLTHEHENSLEERRRSAAWRYWLLSSPEMVPDVKLSGARQDMEKLLEEDLGEIYSKSESRANTSFFYEGIANPLSLGLTMFTLFYLVKQHTAGSLELGQVGFIFGSVVPVFGGALHQMTSTFGSLFTASSFLHSLKELAGDSEEDEGCTQSEERKNITAGQRKIQRATLEVRNLSYSYGDSRAAQPRVEILHEVNATIQEGEFITIVGAIGSGKSTFLELLCGLRSPQDGKLSLGDIPYEEISRDDWHRDVAVCFQKQLLYRSLSIKEFLHLGMDEEKRDSVFLKEVMEATGLEEVLQRRGKSSGLETIIGPEFAGGRNFSGGETQLLALTRALYRRPKILLLDEPTANLNPKQAAHVISLLRDLEPLLGYQPTVVMVSHDMKGAMAADKVLVFSREHRGIVESGAPQELLRRGSIFAQEFLLREEQSFESDLPPDEPEIRRIA